MRKFKILPLLLLLLTMATSVAAQKKTQKTYIPWNNGKLVVSEEGRYLKHENGTPFFWLGETGWLLPERLNRDEAEYYLEQCKRRGYNVIQVQTLNNVPSMNIYGQYSMIDGYNFKNINQKGVYGYWDHMDYIIRTAAKKFAVPMLKSVTSRYGYNIGVTIAEGKHSYGSARNYVTFCGTYVYSFDKDDLRRDMTCVPYKYDKDLNQEIDMGVTGMGVGKWSKLYMQSPLGASSGSNTGINSVRMRFADVLLMYAEAVNELYGPRDDAKEALKRVRRRAFDAAQWTDKVESYVESLTNEADFFQAVMDERKWEFGGEGIRKYDLARWNKYGEVIYNLYNEMTNWGLVANGAYVPGIEKVPSNIYYKQVTDPEHSDRKVLDIVGIDEYGPGVGRPAGYTVLEYALGWRVLNKETQLYETLDAISWSFRGFINKNNDQLVKPTDPVRYLCPYPAKVITDHRGLIRNYYGY